MNDIPSIYKTASLQNGEVSLLEKEITKESFNNNALIIKLKYMGICRADVKEVTGSRDIPEDRGSLFGHEFLGTVIFAGSETGFTVGATITFNPNITPKRTTGFAEYFFINGDKETLSKAVIKVPENVSLNPPWEPEPFACIVHSVNKLLELTGLADFSGKKVAIIGLGNSGMMFGMLIKNLNGKIKFFNRENMRIDFALKQGLFPNEELESLSNFNNYPSSFDMVVVVPTKTEQDILKQAFFMVRDNGIIHLYSGTRKDDKFLDSSVDIDPIRRNEIKNTFKYENKTISVTGGYGCNTKDYEDCFKLFVEQNNIFPLQKLISKEIKLDEFPETIMKMANGSADYPGKVLIRP